jgi:hypothetical protein
MITALVFTVYNGYHPDPFFRAMAIVWMALYVLTEFISTRYEPKRGTYGRVPWTIRLFVVVGTLCLSLPITQFSFWMYATVWIVTYQLALGIAYHRGLTDAHRERLPPDVREMFELEFNRKLVALEDLRTICIKYGVPPPEIFPVIERGFGVRLVVEEED